MPRWDFYPRSPCGERPLVPHQQKCRDGISIHALLAESDAYGRINDISRLIFLSTLSLRRATSPNGGQYSVYSISIHALLAESDADVVPVQHCREDFYPRSPCGERPINPQLRSVNSEFLSTLSLRRATGKKSSGAAVFTISIHALLAESDIILIVLLIQPTRFLSTLSLRRATAKVHKTVGHFLRI